MIETVMPLREITLEPVWLVAVHAIDIDGQPLLDDTGNLIRDDHARGIMTIR
jgi:hypothetical protein